jgi:hypothetical protein
MMASKISTQGGLVDLIVPIYSNHFTHDEIKQMVAFNRTDLGKKMIIAMPLVASESMTVGQKWGNSLAPEIKSLVDQTLAEGGFKHEVQHGITIDETPLQAS